MTCFIVFTQGLSSIEKRFYDRETIAALNYEIHTPNVLPFYSTKMINPFLKLRISDNHDKVDELLANCEIFIKGIVSLLLYLFGS